MKLADSRGSLVGAMVVTDTDEVMAIKASGQVTRSPAADVPAKGRDTMGVRFVTVADSDTVVGIARNTEREVDEELFDDAVDAGSVAVEDADPTVSDRDGTPAEATTPPAGDTGDDVPDSSTPQQDTAPQEDGSE
jgi:DNA gyrase subunit A